MWTVNIVIFLSEFEMNVNLHTAKKWEREKKKEIQNCNWKLKQRVHSVAKFKQKDFQVRELNANGEPKKNFNSNWSSFSKMLG